MNIIDKFRLDGKTAVVTGGSGLYGRYNVRCNVLNLGGFFNNQPEKFFEHYCAKTFLNRMANETDIMGAVVFLASNASAYITGADIAVDGGYSAK